MLCDSLGLPIKFTLTSGECSDFEQAIPLLEGEAADYVIADKGYDSNEIVDYISNRMHAISVIPPRTNRIIQRSYDKYIYKERNQVERLFGKLKNFRKLATRYTKTKIYFEGLICLACSYLWLL